MKLDGKVAIVTGGGRGIGRAIALLFGREGARVAVVARSGDQIADAADEIGRLGAQALQIQTDVSSESDVARMVEETVNRFGQVDILVNNAAVNLPTKGIVDIAPDEWRRLIDVNLTGPYLCARAVLPHMIARQEGALINISSIGGRKGARGRGPYRAAKAGLINLTETLAAEVREHGINVNCICPGGVDTEMIRQIAPGGAVRQLMHPDEIAKVALFLASDDGSAITGTSIDAFGHTNPLFS